MFNLGERTQSERQECLLLGILVHPDRFERYHRVKLIPLATWQADEYESCQPSSVDGDPLKEMDEWSCWEPEWWNK
jgi:hypothetical protein